ncbi:MAG TPA: malto-oligosyltrehalose trehalohydrolase [Gemmatimonadaceae bacterium]|nr:malto-oligosyltrehalose trehalohydrolase [Gemmatimonadaceae bacterium]
MAPSKATTDPISLRRFPIGVEILDRTPGCARVHARVWAPDCRSVEPVIEDDPAGPPDSSAPLLPEGNGYFSGLIANVEAGTRYRFRLDGGAAYPDPASRFQPDGPHGPSMVVDPASFTWTDAHWPGVSLESQVIYELHIGTFTSAGTFQAAIERLASLAELGVTVLEVMPVADFAGRFGWGYDGVNEFAPSRLYGTPDDFRAFVDTAHGLGLGVILDVVYNHLGPDGNYLVKFSSSYFSKKPTEWGDAINFDGERSGPVREFFVTNAAYWIEEFHLDGLRLDATQQIFDESTPHIVSEVADAVRAAAGARHTIVVGENEPQLARLARPRDEGGYGLDALWNDDFHHSVIVAATGRSEAYYSGYRGTPQELLSAVKYGFLYQGEWYRWQKRGRGTPAFDLAPAQFIAFTQNHDQVANSSAGARLHQATSPGRFRALTMLLLLAPHTPMLFQGQEFAASSPFCFFADHHAELATLVRDGRAKFLAQFESVASAEGTARLPDPGAESTFTRCKLDWSERDRNDHVVALHRDLLRLRRQDPVLRAQMPRGVDGAVLNEHAFVVRYFGQTSADDRLLLVNLGPRAHLDPMAEPLLAPGCSGRHWAVALSSESPTYGGWGTPAVDTVDDGWWLPAECSVFLRPDDASAAAR